MPVKKFRPVTPTLRFKTVSSFVEITKTTPEKSLLEPLKKSGGRNSRGRITSRHKGGGHKRAYRRIDFKRNKLSVPAVVNSIEYDPNRSARIALLHYVDGEKRYILSPNGLQVGDQIVAGPQSPIRVGNALPLENMPLGSTVHNVELQPGKGGQLGRSAGAEIQLMAKDGRFATLQLPSGERRFHWFVMQP
jgi:large subunit ribosomal protein L2